MLNYIVFFGLTSFLFLGVVDGKPKNEHGTPYVIKGTVSCNDAYRYDDKRARITTLPYSLKKNRFRNAGDLANKFDEERNAYHAHQAKIKYGAVHPILITGRTQAKAVAIEIDNANPRSKGCRRKIMMVIPLGNDDNNGEKVVKDLGKCNLSTGVCDGNVGALPLSYDSEDTAKYGLRSVGRGIFSIFKS